MLSISRRNVSIFLTDGFSLLAFISLTAPLRIANEILGYAAYSWKIVTHDGGPAQTSCGLQVGADCDLETLKHEKAFDRRSFLALLPGERRGVLQARLVSLVRKAQARLRLSTS